MLTQHKVSVVGHDRAGKALVSSGRHDFTKRLGYGLPFGGIEPQDRVFERLTSLVVKRSQFVS
jgi:hypothetical protein